MLSIIEGMWNRGELDRWYEDAFNILCETVPMTPVFCTGMLWTEIDTHEDLERAKQIAAQLQKEKVEGMFSKAVSLPIFG